jgi:hypothetical protein
VLEVNEDPIWVQPEDVTVRESEPYRARLLALDKDLPSQAILVTDADLPQQTLSLRLVTAPTGARLEGGNFVWPPDEAQGPSTNTVLKQVIATSSPGGRWIGFRASVFSRGSVSGQGIPPELP